MGEYSLHFGDKIHLRAASAYAEATEKGLGYYEKHGRHGILSCVPPVGDDLDYLFIEDEFTVLDPTNRRTTGDVVLYRQPIVLVNQNGQVWNNKTGGITGYVGPRARQVAGEMFVAFLPGDAPYTRLTSRRDRKDNETIHSRRSSFSSVMSDDFTNWEAGAEDMPVKYGDTDVAIVVIDSHRQSKMYNKRLSNFKKSTSSVAGGYLCCDGKGAELRSTIWPSDPQVVSIAVHNKLISPYKYGQKIALPLPLLDGNLDAQILFTLSTDCEAVFHGKDLQREVRAHLQSSRDETHLVLPIVNGPGDLGLTLVGEAPLHAPSLQPPKEHEGVGQGPQDLVNKVALAARRTPVVVFVLVYGVLVRVLWGSVFDASSALQRDMALLVLVIIAGFYTSVKMENPLTPVLLGSPPASADLLQKEVSVHSTLKLIVSGYRFSLSDEKFEANGKQTASRPLVLSSSRRKTKKMMSAYVSASSSGSHIAPSESMRASTSSDMTIEPPKKTPPPDVNSLTEDDVPERFAKAEKGDREAALARYKQTLMWRKEERVDEILELPNEHFNVIKANYPHFYHKRGKNNEPVYYEKPGKIDLKALKSNGVTIDDLLRNYLTVTEYMWQQMEPDDNAKCISIVDVDGIGFSDFAGEAVDYVRKTAAISGQHYPERCAYIFVINVPSWFNMIWNTVKGMVDEVTREKVIIVRGKKKILEALQEKIDLDNIPEEYGGNSPGQSSEEERLVKLMKYLNGDADAPASNPL